MPSETDPILIPAPQGAEGDPVLIPAPQAPPSPVWFMPRSGQQMEDIQARELLETPESMAAGDIRGLGDQPVVPIPRIPQQESLPDRPGAEVPQDVIIPRSGMQQESLEARQAAQDLPQSAAAIANIAAGFGEMAETPQNLAIAPVAPSLPGRAGVTGAAGWGAYQSGQQAFAPDKTLQQRIEYGGLGLAQAVTAALSGGSSLGDIVPTGPPKMNVVPNLTDAGVLPETLQFAGVRGYVPRRVAELTSQVFPDIYMDPEKMSAVTATIRDDNILGGYDQAQQQLADLQASNASPAAVQAQTEAVNNIEQAHDLPMLDAQVKAAKGTWQEPYIRRWEQIVSPAMDTLYNEYKGYDPATPQETRGRHFAARMNLLPDFAEESMGDYSDPTKEMPQSNVTNYRNPDVRRDKFMRKALLTGNYSADTESVLTNSFAGRLRNVALMKFYNALADSGAGQWLEPGELTPDTVGGQDAVRWEAKVPITDPDTGLTRMGIRNLAVQKRLVPEIKQLIGTESRWNQGKIAKAITSLQLYQMADAAAHGKNMHSVLVHSLTGTPAGMEILRRLPFLGTADAMDQIYGVIRQVNEDSPAIRSEIANLQKNNLLRPEYQGQRSKLSPISKTSSVIHQVDTASRILLNRWFDKLVENGVAVDTMQNRYQFVSRLGEYNRALMPRMEAMLRDKGWSPFIVAGKNFNRFSRRLLTGSPGFETTSARAALGSRAKMMSGLIMSTLIPAVVNEVTTGTPGGRKGTPIGSVDLGPQYDTPDGKRRNLDVFQLMGIRRGLKGTGLNAVVEGMRTGETPNEIGGHAITDIVSTALHPYTGPFVGAAERALTGKRFDLRAQKGEPYGPRDIPGSGRFAEQVRVALKEANPPAYSVLQPAVNKAMQSIYGVPAPSSEPAGKPQDYLGSLVKAAIKGPLSAAGYQETVSPALKMARERMTHYQFSPQQDVRFGMRQKIVQAAKNNPGQAQALTNIAQARGIITDADVKAIARRIENPNPLSNAVARLDNPQDALDVFRMATFGEKRAIYDGVRQKIQNSKTLTEPLRNAYMVRLNQLAGPLAR